MKHLRRTFKHACSGVSWKISYFFLLLIPKENRYRFEIPATTVSLFLLRSINIDITIFAMRFNNSPTIHFVRTVSHRVIHRTWNSFARENCPLTENPEGFFSFSFLLFFFSSFSFFDRVSRAKKRGKRTRNIFQCERKSEQYRVKRIGK